MSSTGQDATAATGDVRERLRQKPDQPQHAPTAEHAKETVEILNSAEKDNSGEEREGECRTYGRTPDGTVFTVPGTRDMVSQLFSPSEPKNISDFLLILVLGLHVSMLLWVPSSIRIPVFGLVYLFWRTAYNAGIGWLLHEQSHHKRLVLWAKKSRIFEDPAKGANPNPRLYRFLKQEFETKIPEDYRFEDAPLEYNTWLLFRRVVDVILMCDFVSYCVFAIACGGRPENENMFLTVARWVGGILLFLFNLWVKLDAHRVVKDFAWYWGDFFFLIDQELTFDGVFEMAPHPMYSVGYAGYYGISLMAASYRVLFISILGHAAQFAFLTLVENPHIEKTYSGPPPKKRIGDNGGQAVKAFEAHPDHEGTAEDVQHFAPNIKTFMKGDVQPIFYVATFLTMVHLALLTILTPSTPAIKAMFAANAVFWRLWFSLGTSVILDRQSNKKSWTRLFIKYGETTGEAWRQWKLLYHLSLAMSHGSFIAAASKMYTLPADWAYGMTLLRHVVGLALVALQIWTAVSVYESLGDFGWFFGDFFFEAPGHRLTYSGIYRFLNNPERIIGLAGLWGIAIMTWNPWIFFLALMSHMLSLAFIHFVERPHMQRRYGESLREQSGLSKSFRRTLPQPFRQWQGRVDRLLDETMDSVEDIIESARPILSKVVDTLVSDTRKLFDQYPAKISITKVSPDLDGLDPKDYRLEIQGSQSEVSRQIQQQSGREGVDARGRPYGQNERLVFEYGTPVKVKWTAPSKHAKNDWIGLYMASDNRSRKLTEVSSQSRWVPTNKGEFNLETAEQGIVVEEYAKDEMGDKCAGEVVFKGDKLFWTTGVFEFRYHHAGNHTVMAISTPFEIRTPRFDEDEAEIDANGMFQAAVEHELLPLVQNCFEHDPDISPSTVDEGFGELILTEGKWAKRVVYGVHQMFGIEFAPEVVQADGTVRKLAWRICNAKKVLAPYSMSGQGRSTPTGTK